MPRLELALALALAARAAARALPALALAAAVDLRFPVAAPKIVLLALDSLAHAAVGAACWLAAAPPPSLAAAAAALAPGALQRAMLRAAPSSAASALLCGLAASLLDADHFLSARSLRVDGAPGSALALRQRPFAHSVLFVAGACAALAAWRALALRSGGAAAAAAAPPAHAAALVAVAWLSHQLRDSTRRGLSFWPLPAPRPPGQPPPEDAALSTPPLPYALYLASLLALVVAAAFAVEGCEAAAAGPLLPLTAAAGAEAGAGAGAGARSSSGDAQPSKSDL